MAEPNSAKQPNGFEPNNRTKQIRRKNPHRRFIEVTAGINL
jgi:hypothetical protein